MADFSFRQFQEELRKLEEQQTKKPDGKPLSKKELEAQRLQKAKAELMALCEKHKWGLADVVALFPEEEGIGYLKQMLNEPFKPKRGRKPKTTVP